MKKLLLVGCSVMAVMTCSISVFAAGKTGWVQDKNTWKYYKTETEMAKGWIHSGDGWYYLNEQNGAMETGWKMIGGTWFFLDTRSGANIGKALTGWQWIDGYCYYFSAEKNANEAKLLINTKTPDGFMVDADGRWTVDGKVQYRANYGIITKKSVGTKTSTKKSFGGGSGGGSGRSSGGNNSGSISQGGNAGNSQGNMNQGGNAGNNQGGMNQGGNGGSNQGNMNQDGNAGNNQGDMNQGGNGGSSQGNMNQDGNAGNNQGGMNQGGNTGNNQGNNNGNVNPEGNDQNRREEEQIPKSSAPITGIFEVVEYRDSRSLILDGDQGNLDAYFQKVSSIKLNGKSIEKLEGLNNTPSVGKCSYAEGYAHLIFNYDDLVVGNNILEIKADGYENYMGNFNYTPRIDSPITGNSVEITGNRVTVTFEGDADDINRYLRTLFIVGMKRRGKNGYSEFSRVDINDEHSVPEAGSYGFYEGKWILNKENVDASDNGSSYFASKAYNDYEFNLNLPN